jgi:hypothetical protein
MADAVGQRSAEEALRRWKMGDGRCPGLAFVRCPLPSAFCALRIRKDARDAAEGALLSLPRLVDPQAGAGGHAPYSAIKGVRGRDMAPEEKADVAGRFGGRVHAAAGEEGFDLGGDAEGFAIVC